MSDVLYLERPVALDYPANETGFADCLPMAPIAAAATPDAAAIVAPQRPAMQRPDGFQLPGWVWGAMVSCYATFFLLITLATGHGGHARMAIVISVLYTLMFFGTAFILAGLGGKDRTRPLARAGSYLQTWCGPMSRKAVAGQVLIVPIAMVLFGIGIATVRAFAF